MEAMSEAELVEKIHALNLRRIDLSYSLHLNETPDLSSARNLEIMVLDGCYSLIKFPKTSWSITELDLGETAIEEVPPAIESLCKLVVLRLDNCRRLKNLPSSICNLTSLTELELHGCSNITKFPDISGDMKYLSLSETAIEELPSSASFEFSPQDDDGWPLPNCKVKKCGVCLLLSEEEDRESGDSFNEESGDGFNEIERIGSRSNGGHSEEEDDRNTGRLKENEPKIDARTLWLGQDR
ncbi:hypothetical protein CUMW_216340, partial [Citrus unshiu]